MKITEENRWDIKYKIDALAFSIDQLSDFTSDLDINEGIKVLVKKKQELEKALEEYDTANREALLKYIKIGELTYFKNYDTVGGCTETFIIVDKIRKSDNQVQLKVLKVERDDYVKGIKLDEYLCKPIPELVSILEKASDIQTGEEAKEKYNNYLKLLEQI